MASSHRDGARASALLHPLQVKRLHSMFRSPRLQAATMTSFECGVRASMTSASSSSSADGAGRRARGGGGAGAAAAAPRSPGAASGLASPGAAPPPRAPAKPLAPPSPRAGAGAGVEAGSAGAPAA